MVVSIAWASLDAVITFIAIGVSYRVGLDVGYWRRVREEEEARGVM